MVAVIKAPSGNQRYAHRFEVAGRDGRPVRSGNVLAGPLRASFDSKAPVIVEPGQRHGIGDRGERDTRQLADALKRPFEKCRLP